MNFRQKTIGINFPFQDSTNGDFLDLTTYPEKEIKSDLVHLLLTRKGSRYFLPEFGTNLYQYIFEPLTDNVTTAIQNEIKDACTAFLPNLKINTINIIRYDTDPAYVNDQQLHHKVTVTIDYTITSRTFEVSDDVTITF
jgi:phage baseplate assembly protein W